MDSMRPENQARVGDERDAVHYDDTPSGDVLYVMVGGGGKAFIKVQISAPPPCTPGRPPRKEKGEVNFFFATAV